MIRVTIIGSKRRPISTACHRAYPSTPQQTWHTQIQSIGDGRDEGCGRQPHNPSNAPSRTPGPGIHDMRVMLYQGPRYCMHVYSIMQLCMPDPTFPVVNHDASGLEPVPRHWPPSLPRCRDACPRSPVSTAVTPRTDRGDGRRDCASPHAGDEHARCRPAVVARGLRPRPRCADRRCPLDRPDIARGGVRTESPLVAGAGSWPSPLARQDALPGSPAPACGGTPG